MTNQQVSIQPTWKFTLTTDCIIFLTEFKKYYKNIGQEPGNYNHFFAALFLQVYVEYFLHQFIRTMTSMSLFKEEAKALEYCPLKDRIKPPTPGKLTLFVKLFCTSLPMQIKDLIEDINKNLKILDKIRNSIVHGHDFSKTFTLDQEKAVLSPALEKIENTPIDYLIERANHIGSNWNLILDFLLSKAKDPAYKFHFQEVESFKWNMLEPGNWKQN